MTPEPAAYRLAVSATFTAEPIAPVLSFWSSELGWNCDLQFAPYNQVFQQLLDSSSLLAGNRHGANLVLVRFEDWLRRPVSSPGLSEPEDPATQLISALRSAGCSFPSPLVVCICPPSPAFLAETRNLHQRLEQRVASSLAGASTVHLATVAELNELYPVGEVHDPHADDLGYVPYTPEFFAALGTLLMRKVHALRVAPYKVIALDCDETLWRGICGEDGPNGIVVDPPRRALQEFMVAQHDTGMLLCLASKNNLADVLDTFRMNPAMPLRLDHFTAWRINWEPKASGLAELAQDLELSLDSFILVDDNPKEVSEVEAGHPEVLGLALPPESTEIPAFLRHIWAFDHLRVTEVDQARTALYAQQFERSRARREAASLEEFLASLRLEVQIAPPLAGDLARAAQLTQRTNQMNFTTIRRTESEIQSLLASGEIECRVVHVRDRFGDYGLTGLMLFRAEGDKLVVDTFLVSCRALGRGVEHRMLADLGRIAAERGLAAVEFPFERTQSNLPALLFLESVGLGFQRVDLGNLRFRFPTAHAAAVFYKPSRAPRMAERFPATSGRPVDPANRTSRIPYVRIATKLRDPREVLRRIRSAAPGEFHQSLPTPAAHSELERRLHQIWVETLGTSLVGMDDDFFDLGGHSLLAVQIMSRVRKEFGVELSLELVYSGAFTIHALAQAIELKEFEQTSAEEYAALVREMEGLSDEEVRELLAREDEMR